jgi:hypothetical protein
MSRDFSVTVDELFRKYIPNAEPDKKLVTYWANALTKGDKTKSQFMLYIANYTEYLNFIKYTFIDMFYDHLSTCEDIDMGKLFDKMIISQDVGVPMTEDDIWNWIRNTEVFERQYTDMINKLFLTIKDRVPNEQELQMYLFKLKENRGYSVDALRKDIVGQDGIASDEAAESDAMATKDQPIADEPNKKEDAQRIDLEIVASFEETYERNMNVREYIQYISDLRQSKCFDVLEDHIRRLNDLHREMFAGVKEIMHTYLDAYITENEFIAKYLSRAHISSFLDDVKREVFESDEYKNKMMDKLKVIFMNMYGEKMTTGDAAYMFEHVKKQEVELVSDELNEVMAAFKAQNDEVVQSIFDIFFDVFDREPDAAEQARYLTFIREQKASDVEMDAIKDAIVLDLKQSLEYNDVLKKKIKAAYSRFSTDALFPSKIYQVLDKIVPIKHYKDVDERIDNAVQEILLG